MSEKNLAYRFSNFNTINLEIKDTDYYCKEIDLDSLDFEFNFNIVFVDNYILRIFIHYLYSIEEELDGEKGMLSIYHTDHILMVDFEKSQKDKKYEISFIANLLGTAIVLAR